MRALLGWALAGLGSALAAPGLAAALQIGGMEAANSNVSGAVVRTAVIEADTLSLGLADWAAPVTVRPWTQRLPRARELVGSAVRFERKLQPSGPAQRLGFKRHAEKSDWLVLQTGAPSGQKVMGDWYALRQSGQWWLQRGEGLAFDANRASARQKLLATGAALPLSVAGQGWCLRPHDSTQEQLSWVLVRAKKRGC